MKLQNPPCELSTHHSSALSMLANLVVWYMIEKERHPFPMPLSLDNRVNEIEKWLTSNDPDTLAEAKERASNAIPV